MDSNFGYRLSHSLTATTALLRQFSSPKPRARRALRLEAASLDEATMSSRKQTGLLASKTTAASIVTASPWSSMTIASSSLKADRTGRTRIMSKPGKVGLPVSSPIPACLLPGQPSRRRGPPLVQGGRRIPAMIWRYRRCCPNESQVALPGKSAKTITKALILLNSSGRIYRLAF